MVIPSNIEKQDIINTINEINENGIPPERQSDEYFLVHKNAIYPPKYVISISNKYANKSELLPDQFSGGKESNSFLNSLGFQVFCKPVSSPGKKWLSVTSEENWEKCKKIGIIGEDESKLKTIKEIKVGDVILVYITGMRIAGICEVTKEYYTDKSEIWNDKLYPYRIGIKLLKIPESPINIKNLYDTYFRYKGGAQGYFGQALRELPEHEFSIFHTELARHMNDLKEWNKNDFNVFLTGYDNENLQISKQHKILGWKNVSQVSKDDLVFIYNKTTKKIECGFNIISKSNRDQPIWKDEIKSETSNKIYSNRWDANLICDNLNIGLDDINYIEPFKSDNKGKKAHFGILVLGDSPNSLSKAIYKPFKDYLLDKCNQNKVILNLEGDRWSFDINASIGEILLPGNNDELAIKEEVVMRILNHLRSGKHIILVGSPGVGKTALARRILKIIGKKVIGREDFLQSVASDEWTRFEVIGGINLENKFQEGCITQAVRNKKWLLIDEFNRANMNKAFGEMFLGIEYGQIDLRPSEKEAAGKDYIEIDKDFRMICTMNDFDKNLLLSELSYGLISRFAFVSISADIEKEPEVVQRKIENLYKDISYEDYRDQINTYFNFINEVRIERNIGVRTSIDVIKYLITSVKNNSTKLDIADYKWIILNEALCDYVLPQFDRLDGKTINHVLASANQYLENNAFDNFKNELNRILKNLQKAAGWLDKNVF